jgi:hypothetical protein
MKIPNNLTDKISPVTQSRWILPVLMALSLVTAILGVTGYSPPHPH